MNPIIKVYGYQRSGTSYLTSLLYKNFYDGREELAREVDIGNKVYHLFGEPKTGKFTYVYFGLEGGHDPRFVTKDSIYIVRNFLDVAKSFEDHDSYQTFSHELHVFVALQQRPFVVYYEDLTEDSPKVMSDIAHHFSLEKLHENYITNVGGYCGWKEKHFSSSD